MTNFQMAIIGGLILGTQLSVLALWFKVDYQRDMQIEVIELHTKVIEELALMMTIIKEREEKGNE